MQVVYIESRYVFSILCPGIVKIKPLASLVHNRLQTAFINVLLSEIYFFPKSSYNINRCDALQLKCGACKHSPVCVP